MFGCADKTSAAQTAIYV